ncbi:MAG: response regulator [Deltaproteobacteria bacterium]|nr:response regulator [Deltaproteobacteria bacterium]
MKVLAADSNNRFREGLVSELTNLGYETIEATNGNEALKLLTSDSPINVALAAWDLEGMNGVQLCTELRKLTDQNMGKIHPYVILICEANNPQLLLDAADAGADDYLMEKWHRNDLNVRMRIAERTIDLQQALQKQINDLETVLRRHDLLREVVSKLTPTKTQSAAPETAIAQSKQEIEHLPPRKLNFSEKISSINAFGNLHTTIANVFSQLGCGMASATIPKTLSLAQDLVHLVWTPMYLNEHETWIDIKVEMNDYSARKLYQGMLDVAAQDDHEINDALGEMLNIVQGALKSTFAREGVTSSTLTQPVVLSAHGVRLPKTISGNFEKCEVTIGDIKALFTIIVSDSPVKNKGVDDLLEFDILAKPFYPPRNPNLPVYSEKTVLTKFHARKMRSYSAADTPTVISIIEPSRMARRAMGAREADDNKTAHW